MDKPEFDPERPFDTIGDTSPPDKEKPPFDPSQPFSAAPTIDRSLVMDAGANKPPFDPSKPFDPLGQTPSTEIPSAPEKAAVEAQNKPEADTEQPGPKVDEEHPGFWHSITSAFSKGVAEQAASDAAGTKILLPKGMGGMTFEEQRQDNLLHPKTKDAVDELLEKPISEGWSDPKWWGVQLAKNVGGVSPGLGLALGAGLAAGPLAGIAAFTLEAGLSRLVPAYNAGRDKGQTPTEAIQTALVDTGITMSFATAMGLAGKVPLTGTAKEIVNGEVAKVLTRPALEAMVQIGLVQPTLMASQDIVTDLSHGESPNAEQVLTDMAIGSLAGFGIHETFKSADRIQKIMDARAEMAGRSARGPLIPASEASIAAAAEAQRPKGPTDFLPEKVKEPARPSAEPAAPVGPPPGPGDQEPPLDGPQYDRDITPRPGTPPFFSAVKRYVIEDMPDRMNGPSLLNAIAKQPYVTRGEMSWLGLNEYLKSHTGQVEKKDILAHIEAKEALFEEVKYQDPPAGAKEAVSKAWSQNLVDYGADVNAWPANVRQHYENLRAIASQFPEPQWKTWNPPGAQNIREFVLKAPAPSLHPADIEAKAAELWNETNGRGFGPWERVSEEGKETWRNSARTWLYRDDPRVFVGGHYLDPNAFAHVRLADYVDHNGRRLLGLMEAQSDIHQEAEKMGKGYMPRDLPAPAVIDATVEEARQTYDTIRRVREDELKARGQDPDRALLDPKVKRAQEAWRNAVEESNKYWQSMRGKLPNLPFKTEWQELAVKRVLMLAADEGYDGVFWLNGDQVGLRLHDRQELKGARQNYGPTLNNLFKKWAKYVGSYTEPTRIVAFQRDWAKGFNERQRGLPLDTEAMKVNMWMPVGPEHSSIIQKGLPLWDKDVQGKHPAKGTRTLSEALMLQDNPNWRRLLPAAKKLDSAMMKIANEFKVRRGISILTTDLDQPWRGRLKEGWDPATGNYMIEVNLRRILTEHDLYAAMSHEMGHVLYKELYETASDAERAALNKAYNDYRAKIPSDQLTVADVRRIRDNAISETTGARDAGKDLRISDLDPGTKAYLLGKYEWWAEQVAKWMTTDAKPLGVVEKFFKRLANKIRKMIGVFSQTEQGPNAKPDQAVADFLNSKYGISHTFMEGPDEQYEMDTKKKAQAAFDREGAPETRAVPQQASTAPGREIIKGLPPEMRGNGEGMAAAGDTMNWFYNIFTSLPQVARLNMHLRDLAEYTDMHRLADLMRHEIMGKAQDRDRQWAAIRDPKELERITNFISDYAEGKFKLPHTEDGIFRRPNEEEFRELVKKHGLSDQSVKLFQGLVTDFDTFLERYRKLLVNDAFKIKDDASRKNTIANINVTMDKLMNRPFMPLTRFGKYSITVYGADNKIRHYEQTNSLRRQKQIVEALEKHPDRLPGDRVVGGMVPKDVRPFLGMPPGLVDLISKKLSLSDTQRGMLDQLKFDYAPAQTFKHQFRNLDLTPGWSTDYRRAYAHFFFHGGTHVTRITFADKMRDAIARLGSEENRIARAGRPGGTNKLDKIVKYVQAHFDAFIDPKSDWAAVRGLMFHWYLGFNPASALVNLTQTPLMTHPYLASWFGDLQSAKAIAKASTDLNNFYRKTTLQAAAEGAKDVSGYEAARARAFGQALNYGTLSETQTHNLAALAEDRNLLRIFGTKAERFWLKFQEASSWMFETSEQWNRRVAFAAAWDLAYNRPNHGLIQESQKIYPLIYKELTNPAGKNMSAHEAGAFLAAMRAVDQTQFTYSPYARPPIMRGKLGGTALVFKLFTQNSMFNIISNPSMAWRWALVMGALGGLQGLMGFENVNSLLKTLAYRAFGADFDLEDQARHFAHDVLNDVIPPDILMHGLSSQSFGIPHVLDSMGIKGFPTVDLSKSVGMGDVLGFDPFKPAGPVRDPKAEILKEGTRAMGAAFSLPLNLYEFAAGADNFTSLKKYENIMPRWLGNLSKAERYWTQGKEVNAAGNAVVRFDPADTQQMMEILAQAAGLQPRRKTEEWARIQATAQAAAYWDLRRQGLMRQFADAIKNNDTEGRDNVVEAVRKYNSTLPPEARTKAITSKELKASVQQRLRAKALQEQGLPSAKANIPLAREVEKYYPRGWPADLQGLKSVQ